jgi:CBS domain-containing protein
MKVREIMTKNPACCTPDTNLQEVAQMMVQHDCGCIPVVDSDSTMKPVGTITDRDITVRAFANNQNPLEMKASDVMTTDIVSVRPGTSVEQCCDIMENKQIRRVLVVDESGKVSGIVAQADVAQNMLSTHRSGELVREISESSDSQSSQRFDRQPRYNSQPRFKSQPRHDSVRNVQNRRDEMEMWGGNQQSRGKSAFLTGTILPLLVGVGGVAAISFYLKQQEESSRPALERRTSSTPLNTRNTDDKISSDFLAPKPAIANRTGEDTVIRSTSTSSTLNRDEDTTNNLSFGTTPGSR